MVSRLRKRLTYANTVATLALFIALGGSSYAAFRLPANSVGSKQLKKGAVTAAKIKPHSLLAKDFQSGQLPTGLQGPQGEKGDPGLTGPPGQNGQQGPPGPFETTLPSGQTLRGVYYIKSGASDTHTFVFPLASAPTVHFVGSSATKPPECQGTPSNPSAAPGNLCVYASPEGDPSNTAVSIGDPVRYVSPFSSPMGFLLDENDPSTFSTGSWAVTAP